MSAQQKKAVLEAVLFLESEPLSLGQLAEAIMETSEATRNLLKEMASERATNGAGVVLEEIAGKWQFCTNPLYFAELSAYVAEKKQRPLSEAALEVLAVVAYTQPTTRETIRSIRGVNSDSILSTLISRGLVKEVGKAEPPSNARLYGTTTAFLSHFGLASTKDLPSLAEFSSSEEAARFIAERLKVSQADTSQLVTGDVDE